MLTRPASTIATPSPLAPSPQRLAAAVVFGLLGVSLLVVGMIDVGPALTVVPTRGAAGGGGGGTPWGTALGWSLAAACAFASAGFVSGRATSSAR